MTIMYNIDCNMERKNGEFYKKWALHSSAHRQENFRQPHASRRKTWISKLMVTASSSSAARR